MHEMTGATRSDFEEKFRRAVHVFLGLRNERARRRIFIGCAVGDVGEVGDWTLSFELEMLPDEAERRRDSSIVAWRSTLA